MAKRKIRELREKIGTDPILTDEEIEHIWTAMDKAEPMKPIKDKYGDCDCPICNASVEFSGVNTYSKHRLCPSCGQAIDWEEQMRDILFRGKRIDNGEWVYGNLIRRNVCVEEWELIPETVGQYTGLDDKYGGKIFEGDVMHWDSHWGWYVGYENGAFRRIPLNDIQRINWRHHTLQQEGLDTWEIIGNIYDNPELMEWE